MTALRRVPPAHRGFARVLLVLVVAALVAMAMPACRSVRSLPDPAKPGRYPVGRSTIQLVDLAREGRQVTTDVWYPASANGVDGAPKSEYDLTFAKLESPNAYADVPISTAKKFPLVVFSHGSGTIRFQSFSLMEHLASQGYIVVAPDHKGHTINDELFGTTSPWGEAFANRHDDLSYVITEFLNAGRSTITSLHRFAGTIDDTKIAAMGHSVGAVTALAGKGGFQDDLWNVDLVADRRIDVTITIGPAVFFMPHDSDLDGSESPSDFNGFAAPNLTIGGTEDEVTPVAPNSERVFTLLPTNDKFRVDVVGASHGSSSDVCLLRDALEAADIPENIRVPLMRLINVAGALACSPPVRSGVKAHHDIQEYYAVAFLKRYLDGDTRYAPFLLSEYANKWNVDYWRMNADGVPTGP